MAKIIKIGTTYLNIDRIHSAEITETSTEIELKVYHAYEGGDTLAFTRFRNDEARRLIQYLNSITEQVI